MPRPSKPANPRRNAFIGVRLPEQQRRKVVRAARRRNLTISDYICQMIDAPGKRPAPRATPTEIVPLALLAQWQRVGNNVNQVSRAMNRGRNPAADHYVDTFAAVVSLMIDDQLTRRHALRFGLGRLIEHPARG